MENGTRATTPSEAWRQGRRAASSKATAILSLIGALFAVCPGSASALVFTADEFEVSTSSFFDDSFNRNTTLNGGSGSSIYSGVNINGNPATHGNYFTWGTVTETTANNGQATFDTSTGPTTVNPDNFPSADSTQRTGVELEDGFTKTSSYSTKALFELTVPTSLSDYSLELSNYSSISGIGSIVGVEITDCAPGVFLCGAASGPEVLAFLLDFTNDTDALLGEAALTPTELASDDQILMTLSNAASGVVSAQVALGNGNTLSGFTANTTITLGSTSGLYATSSSAEAEISGQEVFPAPEPNSLLLLGMSVVGLGILRRRKRPLQA